MPEVLIEVDDREASESRKAAGKGRFSSARAADDGDTVHRGSRMGEVVTAAVLEEGDEVLVHVRVVVRDVEHADLFACEAVAELLVETGAVDFFHDEDEIGPFDLFLGEHDIRTITKARRVDVDARVVRKDRLRSGAAEFVFGAEEEDVFHWGLAFGAG